MKIFFIVSEDRFYKPAFFEKILKARKEDVIGIAIISGRNKKYSFFDYVKMYLNLFGPITFIRLGIKDIWYSLLNTLSSVVPLKRFYSTEKVAEKYGIAVFKPRDVNNPSFIDGLRGLSPDVIVSSCAQIFKKDLLELPNIVCINRHTALLPKYGGVWPVFWAMLNDEKDIGVTIHEMVPKIDEGKIITQGVINRDKSDSMSDLYKKGLELSADLVLEALDIIEQGNPYKRLTPEDQEPEYNSFPTRKDAKKFLQKGYKFL